MKAGRIYSVEVLVVGFPGGGDSDGERATVRYCDECRRWGATATTHLCGRNWRLRLSDLLLDLARERRR
jgi:hypothetical protein